MDRPPASSSSLQRSVPGILQHRLKLDDLGIGDLEYLRFLRTDQHKIRLMFQAKSDPVAGHVDKPDNCQHLVDGVPFFSMVIANHFAVHYRKIPMLHNPKSLFDMHYFKDFQNQLIVKE